MEIALCDRFPAFTPLSLRRERAREVFLLINRFNNYSDKENNPKSNERVIHKQADNSWF